MSTSRANWTKDSAPVELMIPIEGRDPVADRIERQFDQLLDLLACDQALEGKDLPRRREPLVADEAVVDEAIEPEQAMLELSIVMPCLDEAETVGNCVLKAQYALEKLGIPAK